MQLVPVARSAPFVGLSFTIRAVLEINQWTRWQILCRAFLSLIASAIACPAVAAKPVVYDTNYEIIHKVLTPSVYWIDNERLLFEGIKTSDMNVAVANRERDRVKRLKKLYLWDKKSGSVRFYAEGSNLCVSSGVLHYTVRTDKTGGIRIVKRGPLGLEQEGEIALPTKEELSPQGQMARVRGDITCKTYLRAELSPPASQGRRIIVLRDGDGYLDAGPEGTIELVREIRATGPGRIKLFRPGNPTPIELPMTLEQGPGSPIYSEYLGAYVTFPRPKGSDPGHSTDWPHGLPFTVYTFKATGQATDIEIPYDRLVNIAWVQPTRRGWLFGGGNFYRSLGLYLFDGTALSRLDAGAVNEIAVAPDGCRAAVAIQNKHLDMGTPINLRIFDLCERGP